MNRLFRKYFFLFVCIYGLFFFIFKAEAFSVFPLRHSVVVDPGKSESVFMDLKNNGTEVKDFVFEVDAFELNPDNGNIQFGKSDEAKAWLSPKPATVQLSAGESKRVLFTIAVPHDASPGSHYLALVAKEKSSSAQVSLGARIATLLFLHVAGPVQETLVLRDFSSDRSFAFGLPVKLYVQLENAGTIHLVPEGKIILSNWRGKFISELSVNSQNRKILPGEKWNEENSIQDLSWKNIGKVHVTLLLHYGLTEGVVIGEKTFWYIPWPVMVLFLGFLLTISFFLFKKKRVSD